MVEKIPNFWQNLSAFVRGWQLVTLVSTPTATSCHPLTMLEWHQKLCFQSPKHSLPNYINYYHITIKTLLIIIYFYFDSEFNWKIKTLTGKTEADKKKEEQQKKDAKKGKKGTSKKEDRPTGHSGQIVAVIYGDKGKSQELLLQQSDQEEKYLPGQWDGFEVHWTTKVYFWDQAIVKMIFCSNLLVYMYSVVYG